MKRYSELTTSEKLSLTDDDLYQAVKVEALERGIKIPITLENHLQQQEWAGFQTPPDCVFFYELVVPERYGQAKRTGIAFRTVEQARAAIQGCTVIGDEDYTTKLRKIEDATPTVMEAALTLAAGKSYRTRIEAAPAPPEEWVKLLDECRDDFAAVRQAKYNHDVALAKRKEYLALAGGDETVARRFWAKVEGGEFPAEEDSKAAALEKQEGAITLNR